MKKTLRSVLVFALLTVPAFAAQQTRSRVFDNFDTARGVQIVVPTIAPLAETKKQTVAAAANKKFVKKTAQVSMAINQGVALKSPANYAMSAGRSLGAFTTGDDKIDSYIVDSCRKYSIDPLLIYSQMHQESSFKSKAMSYKGARGLMQLMPGTAARFGVADIYNPQQNIEGGVKYMRWLLDLFGGDIALALAGYNAGEGAVLKFGRQIPPYRETQEYVRRITDRYVEVTNPNLLAKTVRKLSTEQAEKLEEKTSAPLTVYEPSATAIKLADGRMRLVNQ